MKKIPDELVEPVETGLDTLLKDYCESKPSTKPGKLLRAIVKLIPTHVIIGMLLHKINNDESK
jgi:hypothetical protein